MLNVGAFRFLSSSPELRNSPESHQRSWTSLHPPIEVQIPIKDPIQKHSRSLCSSFKTVEVEWKDESVHVHKQVCAHNEELWPQ